MTEVIEEKFIVEILQGKISDKTSYASNKVDDSENNKKLLSINPIGKILSSKISYNYDSSGNNSDVFKNMHTILDMKAIDGVIRDYANTRSEVRIKSVHFEDNNYITQYENRTNDSKINDIEFFERYHNAITEILNNKELLDRFVNDVRMERILIGSEAQKANLELDNNFINKTLSKQNSTTKSI